MNARRLIPLVLATTLAALAFTAGPALAAAPTIEETFTTEVAATSATLHAKVNPGGLETTYTFEYAPAGGAFKPVPEPEGSGSLPEGDIGVPVSVHVQQGLAPGASYEFRIVVGNAAQKDVAGEPVSFTTQRAGGEFLLPDGRQYEMVSPPEKEGARIFRPGPFYEYGTQSIQASVAGNAMVYLASQPTEAEPQGYNGEVSVLSTRSSTGWSSQVIAPPHVQGGGPSVGGPESRLFSEDLSHSIVQPVGQFSPYSPDASEQTPYLRTDYLNQNVSEHCQSSCYQPLVTRADDTASPFVPFGGGWNSVVPGFCENQDCGPFVEGASPDLGHVVFYSPVQLTSMSGSGLYEWYGGHLRLVPGCALAGFEIANSPIGANEETGAGRAISEDGERVITACPGGGIDITDVATAETLEIGGSDGYMTASSDASKVFFISGGDLKVFEVTSGEGEPLAGRVVDLTVDPHVDEQAGVIDVLGASDDGSYVYFAAGGALAPGAVPAVPGPQGTCAPVEGTKGGCNVYVYHDGVTSLVSAAWISSGRAFLSSRASPDGRWLAFTSTYSLTGYDNRDAVSGEPDAEVYLYDADTGRLACASCDPTGARPVGEQPVNVFGTKEGFSVAANVPGWEHFYGFRLRYQSDYLSDGGRLFFESPDALVPQDANGVGDVYEYEPEGVPVGKHACSSPSASGSEVFKPTRAFEVGGRAGEEGAGCVSLISSGTSSEASSFMDASETGGEGSHGEELKEGGGDVFFLTTSRLAPQDFDAAADVYDAHECTNASPCIPPPAAAPSGCSTEASCKASPTPQPSIYGLPSSATFSGPGNLTPPPPVAPTKVTKKTVKCKKGFVKSKKGKCVKNKKKKTKAKKASDDRRAKR